MTLLLLLACRADLPDTQPGDSPALETADSTVDTGDWAGRVQITELMADNRDALVLPDGSSPDWVELFNPGPDPVDLAGWTLVDGSDHVALPDARLVPGAFLVVPLQGGPVQLSADGESLALHAPNGAQVDHVTWGPQRPDVSWGRPQLVETEALLQDGDAALLSPGAPQGWQAPQTDDTDWIPVVLPIGVTSAVGPSENLALFAPTEQSTDAFSRTGAQAVDDDPTTISHTATADFEPWWQVDLGADAAIHSVVLLNRMECCRERLYNVTVSVLDTDGATVWTSAVLNPVPDDGTPSDPGDSLDPQLPETQFGRTVRVDKHAVGGTYESEWLSLAEVQVWGAWSAPYAQWIATDVGAHLQDDQVTVRVTVPAAGLETNRLTLYVRADDAFDAQWDGAPVASDNLDSLASVQVTAPTAWALDPALAQGGLLAVRLIDAGDDDALLGLELVAQAVETVLDETAVFPEPTPGEPNGQGLPGFVQAPQITPERGWLDGPTVAELWTDTPDATLAYTLDGSVPGPDNGVRVQGVAELDLDGTTLVRAVAWREGWGDSRVVTHTFLDLDQVVAQPAAPEGVPATWDGLSQEPIAGDYEMDPEVALDPAYQADLRTGLLAIPAVSIVMPGEDLWADETGIYVNSTQRGAAWERAASVEFLEPDGDHFQGDCGVRIHGYGWRPHSNTRKHSLRLEFRRDYGESKLTYPLFPDAPVDRFDSIVLRAQGSRGWQDFRDPEQAQYIRDAFARDTARDMGKDDGHAAFVHLFLNGLYWGLYMAVERPDADFGAERFGGDADEYDAINRRTTTNEAIDGDLVAYNELLALSDQDLTVAANYDAVAAMIDMDDLIDYMLIHQYTTNRDGPEQYNHNNMRGVRRRVDGERFRFFVWDMEYSLWNATDNYNIDVDVAGSVSHVYARLRANPEFRDRYGQRAQTHLDGGALSADAALARWETRAAEIQDAIVAESARWGDADRSTPYTRDVEWAEERRRLTEEYFPARTEVLIQQLRDAGLYPE